MSAIDLNDGLARFVAKKGEVRNPTGRSGTPGQRQRAIEIKRALFEELRTHCTEPGYEGLSKWDRIIIKLVDCAMSGERWAIALILNRCFGRIPMQVDVTTRSHQLHTLSNTELHQRVEDLRQQFLDIAPLRQPWNEPEKPEPTEQDDEDE